MSEYGFTTINHLDAEGYSSEEASYTITGETLAELIAAGIAIMDGQEIYVGVIDEAFGYFEVVITMSYSNKAGWTITAEGSYIEEDRTQTTVEIEVAA